MVDGAVVAGVMRTGVVLVGPLAEVEVVGVSAPLVLL
jgi:hypothetical protein